MSWHDLIADANLLSRLDGAGDTPNDATANNNDGVWTGTPGYSAGMWTNTRSFNFSNAAYLVTTFTQPATSLTIHFNAITSSHTASDVWAWSKNSTINTGTGYVARYNTTPAIELRGSGSTTFVPGFTWTTSVWHAVTITFDGTTATIYADGVNRGSGTIQAVVASAQVYWGVNNVGTSIWNGYMDDLRIYNRTLSEAEAFEIHDGPEPTNTVAPVASGDTEVGSELSCTTGTWDSHGNGTLSYSYQWQADAVSIGGATSSTFDTTGRAADESITCLVRGTNDGGFHAVHDTSSNAIVLTETPAAVSIASSITFPVVGSAQPAVASIPVNGPGGVLSLLLQ